MLALGDDNAERGYQEIIDTYREAKQWPQATAAAKEAVQKMPNDRDLRMVLAAQLADTGDADKPLADVRSLLKGTPEDREVYIPPRPDVHARSSAGATPRRLSTRPSSFPPSLKTRSTSISCAARLYERQKKFDQAEAEFRKVLAHAHRRRAPRRSIISAT